GRTDAVHPSPRPSKGPPKNAAAAADIEDAKPGQAVEPARIAVEMAGRPVANESKPHRIEFVQRRHRAPRVPPLAGEPRKSCDLLGVDRVRAGLPPFHFPLSSNAGPSRPADHNATDKRPWRVLHSLPT